MFPEFENEFLADVALSLRKRRKSLKHRVDKVACDKVYEVEDDQRTERIEIGLQRSFSARDIRLRLHAWPDRWVWVDGRKASGKGEKGWAWEWTFEGRLLGAFSGRDLIAAVEQSLFQSSVRETNSIALAVSEIWHPLLAKGPVGVE